MPAPLPPFQLPASVTQPHGGVRMSLNANHGPVEFLGESDDDPLIPLDGEQALRSLVAILQECQDTGQVDLEELVGRVIDVEVRAELGRRHNVRLISALEDARAELFSDYLGDARHLAGECGFGVELIEAAKHEYGRELERVLLERLAR